MRSQLSNSSSYLLFQDLIHVETLSIVNDARGCKTDWQKIQEADALERQTTEYTDHHRIYLISKAFSWGRLNITEDAFNKLLITEEVFEQYNSLVKTFAQRVRESNSIHLILHTSQLSVPGDRLLDNYEFCYNVYYIIPNDRLQGDPWSLRETAIYQRLNIVTNRSRWIIIQLPQAARTVLEKLDKNAELCMDVMVSKYFELHLLLIMSMSNHWSGYIEFLGTRIDSLDMKASYSEIEDTGELECPITFADCQSINILQSKLRKARLALECCQDLARGLEHSWRAIGNAHSLKVSSESLVGLQLYIAEMGSYAKNIGALLDKSYGIGSLLSKMLEFREVEKAYRTSRAIEKSIHALEQISNQSNETSRTLANLARETNKDSLTLKTLTLIATIYLPATLTATIFSSNLVQSISDDGIDIQSTHFHLAPQFWVFIVVTLCFTVFTFSAFLILCYMARRSAGQRPRNAP